MVDKLTSCVLATMADAFLKNPRHRLHTHVPDVDLRVFVRGLLEWFGGIQCLVSAVR